MFTFHPRHDIMTGSIVTSNIHWLSTTTTIILLLYLIFIIIIIIIITRPKPAYGRQGLAGFWGQDKDEVSAFLVFLTSHIALQRSARIKPTWDH